MAYYDDGYMWAQEHTTFFPLAHQDPVSFSSYEPYGDHVGTNYVAYNVSVFDQEPKSIDLDEYGYGYDYGNSYDYDNDYDYGNCNNWYLSGNPSINYFAHNYMEPKLIAYEPVECHTGYVRYHIQNSISYSKVELGFNEPEFEEYDPTPYGGGYDIEAVYGKPVPPSNQTCYPRSKPKQIGLGPTPNSEAEPQTKAHPAPAPAPAPVPQPKPMPEPTPMSIAAPIPLVELKPEPKPKPQQEPANALVPVSDPLDLSEIREREREEYSYPGYGYDYPWPEYDNPNASSLGYDYGYGRQVVQIPPCEYSPEVVDFCESIFGSLPCLARTRKQQMSIDNNPRMSRPETDQLSPWEGCAGYIFGRPMASYNV